MSKFWMRIGISLFLIFLSLSVIWLVKAQQISLTPIGNFVLTIGGGIGFILGFGLLFLFVVQLAKQEKKKSMYEEREDMDALQKCEKMLYIIRKIAPNIDKGEFNESQANKIKDKVGPYIKDLTIKHKGFLHRLAEKGYGDIRNIIYDIATSLKHPHFNPRRAMMYISQLEKSLSKYLNI